MTLDEAIRQARLAVDAPHPAGYISDHTSVSRAVLRQVLDELSATSRGMTFKATGLDAQIAQAQEIEDKKLRDRFAMHAPMAPLPDGMGGNAAEREILRNRARVALQANANEMMRQTGRP